MTTDKTLNAIRPSEASRSQAMALAKQGGFGGDFEARDELVQWLEVYFSERKGDRNALAVADAIYDDANTVWLAKCLGLNSHELRKALGKDGTVKCEAEGCKELVPKFLMRVKNGYSPATHRNWYTGKKVLCPDCKRVFDGERREKEQAAQERYEASRQRGDREHHQARARRAKLLSHLPRRGRGNFEKFLNSSNILRLALTCAANKVLTTPVQFITTARFTPERYSNWFYWAAQERLQDAEITCDQCYRRSGLAVFSRDLLDVYFSFVVQNADSQIIGMDEMPVLRYLIANGEEAFASSLLREWVRGKVFGNPDFLILCPECSGNNTSASDEFFKLSHLDVE